MRKNHIARRRAGLGALILSLSVILLGARPSAAADPYRFTKTFEYSQPTFSYEGLAGARTGWVGITPIPIP